MFAPRPHESKDPSLFGTVLPELLLLELQPDDDSETGQSWHAVSINDLICHTASPKTVDFRESIMSMIHSST
jgi:hypothetical protein